MDNLHEIVRHQFPALERKVFLDAACVSLAPRVAVDAVSDFLQTALHCPARSATLQHIAMDEAREAARPEAARLINAEPEEIALVESTTHALTIAARAVPIGPGDNLLVPDLEFLQVPLAWRQAPPGRAPEVRMVSNVNGTLPASAFADQMDERTRAVVLSSVQWSNGVRCDLAAIGALCRERGVFLIVDAIQQLGAIRLDVTETPVDILACGGHKWLNAPFGAGFLYVSRSVWDRLAPPLSGYLAVLPPAGGWGAYFQTPSISPLQPVSFWQDARRFETGGTANYPGAIGLAASLRQINGIGTRRIDAYVRALTDRLLDGLRALGLEIVTPVAPELRSGIVTFRAGRTAADDVALMEYLLDREILVSVRFTSGVGGVRVSCHFFNSAADLDRLLEAVEAYAKRR
jgi:selenocysteine lyase/cysteine desulfurase